MQTLSPHSQGAGNTMEHPDLFAPVRNRKTAKPPKMQVKVVPVETETVEYWCLNPPYAAARTYKPSRHTQGIAGFFERAVAVRPTKQETRSKMMREPSTEGLTIFTENDLEKTNDGN